MLRYGSHSITCNTVSAFTFKHHCTPGSAPGPTLSYKYGRLNWAAKIATAACYLHITCYYDTYTTIHTPRSMIFWKCTLTVQLLMFGWSSLEWIKMLIFFDRIFDARYPNTNSMESMTLDFPLPFGPTMDEKFYNSDQLFLHCSVNSENMKIHVGNKFL